MIMQVLEYKTQEEKKNWHNEQGIEQGIEQGKNKKEIEAILGFYANGVPIEIIAKSLTLSIERVTQIIGNHST